MAGQPYRSAERIVRSRATTKDAASDMMSILGYYSSSEPESTTHASSAGAAERTHDESSGSAGGGDGRSGSVTPTPEQAVDTDSGTNPSLSEPEAEPSLPSPPVAFDPKPPPIADPDPTSVDLKHAGVDPVKEEAVPVPATMAADVMEEAMVEVAETTILNWRRTDSPILDYFDDIAELFDAVEVLIKYINGGGTRPAAGTAVQTAMVHLEEAFRYLLTNSSGGSADSARLSLLRRISLSSSSRSSSSFTTENIPDDSDPAAASAAATVGTDNPPEHVLNPAAAIADQISPFLISSSAVPSLKKIADLMISGGYGPELCQVYADVRRDALVECIIVLGVEKTSLEDAQRVEWPAFDAKMKRWAQALKLAVRGLLAEEHHLCSQVFGSQSSVDEECFAEASKSCLLQLLNFADAISICKHAPEKLFRILNMYEALSGVLPDLEGMLSGDAKELIKQEASGILDRLGDAVRATVYEFTNAIQGEASKKVVPGGDIHPLSRYVMNYVKLLTDYSSSLNALLDDDVNERENPSETANMSPLGYCVLTLITKMQTKLEEKARFYEDEALQNVFLMNNLWYTVHKVRESELKDLLGEGWIRKRRGQIRQYSTAYIRAAWTKVLSFLKDDGLSSGGNSATVKANLKEKFRNFNLAFEEVCKVQTTWKVSDPQVREEMKISVSEKVIPAYRAFVGRFGQQLEGGRNPGRYIKYTPEELESHLSELFEGRRPGA